VSSMGLTLSIYIFSFQIIKNCYAIFFFTKFIKSLRLTWKNTIAAMN